MSNQLTWNPENDTYECEYGDGKTMYVDGDAWAESRLERARELLSEKHPEVSPDEIQEALDTEEGEAIWKEATNDLLDPDTWALSAEEIGADDDPATLSDYPYVAWIQ